MRWFRLVLVVATAQHAPIERVCIVCGRAGFPTLV
jgi:hypothetical protein